MSESAETVTNEVSASKVTSTSNGERLREELQNTHALHTEGQWVRGQLMNFRLRPKFEFLGTAFDESKNIEQKNYSIRDLHGSYTRRACLNDAPFVTMDDRSVPYGAISISSIDKEFVKATSMEDLYLVDSTEDEYVLVPMEGMDLEHHRTDCYLVGSVEFEVVADLSSDEVLRSQSIVLDELPSVESVKSCSYFDEVKEFGKLDVEYLYADDELSVRHLPEGSRNVVSNRQLVQGVTVTGFVGWLLGWWFGVSEIVTSMFGAGGWMWVVMIGLFVGYSWLFVKAGKAVYKTGKERAAIGEKHTRIEVLGEASENVFGNPVISAVEVSDEKERIQEKAERLQSELQKYPREVTVEPSENASRLQAVDRRISWNVTDGNMVSEDSVEFFIEYGWTEDFEQIDTHMVQDLDAVPDHLPALESSCGDWYLLPEEIQVDPIIEI